MKGIWVLQLLCSVAMASAALAQSCVHEGGCEEWSTAGHCVVKALFTARELGTVDRAMSSIVSTGDFGAINPEDSRDLKLSELPRLGETDAAHQVLSLAKDERLLRHASALLNTTHHAVSSAAAAACCMQCRSLVA